VGIPFIASLLSPLDPVPILRAGTQVAGEAGYTASPAGSPGLPLAAALPARSLVLRTLTRLVLTGLTLPRHLLTLPRTLPLTGLALALPRLTLARLTMPRLVVARGLMARLALLLTLLLLVVLVVHETLLGRRLCADS